MSAWDDAVAAISSPTLELWWKLDESGGTTVASSAGSGRTGKITDNNGSLNHAWGQATIPPEDDGTSLNIPGVDIQIDSNNPINIASNTMTRVMWFRTTSTQSNRHMSALGNTKSQILFHNGNLQVLAHTQGGSGNSDLTTVGLTLNDGEPHMIAVTQEGKKTVLYIDGAYVQEDGAVNAELVEDDELVIGGRSLNPNLAQSADMDYDEILLFDGLLSADQISDLYDAGAVAGTSGVGKLVNGGLIH